MQQELEQLVTQVRRAAEMRTPLEIRGSGSKAFYGRSVQGEALDLTRYSGIVDYEPSELVVTARAGTKLADLQSVLGNSGQMLAFEPPCFSGGGTLGGAIATGLSGPRRPFAGAARDFVLGVRIVDGKGQDLSFGGRVIKNVAGFDVSRLMAGSLGTLGVITEVSLKTLPIPPAEMTLSFAMDETKAIRAMNEWAGQSLPLSATWFHDGEVRVRLSGAASALAAAHVRLGGEIVSDAADFWQRVRNHDAPFFAGAETLWRVSLPSTAPPLGIELPQVIEWGGALRWLSGPADAVQLASLATRLGGHATQFRSRQRAADPFHPLAAPLLSLHKRLKNAMDPHGILNPGRMYRDF